MSKRIVSGTIISLLFVSGIAFADRTLERAEILQIFEQLTSQPRRTWIPAGTIEATHQEYKAAVVSDENEINRRISAEIQNYQKEQNKRELTEELQKMKFDAIPFNIRYELTNEYTMSSTELLKFDGSRFYWEINVDLRTESVKPGRDLADNSMTQNFDLEGNKKRIFTWDGEKYTRYFQTGHNSIVDVRSGIPHPVNGPLTAGIVPWGYGYYTYDNLVNVDSSAVEKDVAGETQVHLTLAMPDGITTIYALSSSKDYALVSYLATGQGKSVAFRKYSDYRLVADKWVPTTILLEKYDSGTNRLLARDLWSISRIDSTVPGVENFDVNYDTDAQVEFISPVTRKPAVYNNSGAIDTESLLAERLAYDSSQGAKNCATAALKYTLLKLGKEVPQDELALLVSGTTGSTSLAVMKQFVQSLGLYCRAVKTDVQTMKNLKDCQAILYIPGKEHYIVLEAVDDKYVWTIDLSSDKFYYRTDKDFFGMDWTDGMALLISNQPIGLQGNFVELAGNELANITGGTGYACTNLLQDANVILCSEPVDGVCAGTQKEYYQRWGCVTAPSGSCSSLRLLKYIETPCIKDIYEPLACTGTGVWTSYYMRACQ